MEGCRDSVENIIELTKNCNVGDIQKLIGSLSFHDFYTFDHSINVCMYSMALLRSINFKTEKKELINLGIGGLLHDLGKIKISTSVINKADKLSEAEFNAIKEHPLLGGEILEDHLMSGLSVDVETIKRTITEHHENFDGTGYLDVAIAASRRDRRRRLIRRCRYRLELARASQSAAGIRHRIRRISNTTN